MKKCAFFSLHLLYLLLVCANAYSATNSSVNSNKEVQQSLSELQHSYQSAQKINSIFSQCQMKYKCITNALQQMVDKDNDPLAKEVLGKLSKQAPQSFEEFNQCFEFERNEVNNALSICMAESHGPPLLNQGQCSEKALLALIDSGNSVAQMALLKLYELQGDVDKYRFLKEKLNQLEPALSEKAQERCKKHTK